MSPPETSPLEEIGVCYFEVLTLHTGTNLPRSLFQSLQQTAGEGEIMLYIFELPLLKNRVECCG